MEIIVTLLKELSGSLSAVDIVIVICLIGVCSFAIVNGVLKLIGHKSGLPIFNSGPETVDVNLVELRNIRSSLDALTRLIEVDGEKQLNTILDKLNEKVGNSSSDKSEIIELINEKMFDISSSIGKLSSNLTLAINDVKNQVETNSLIDKANLDEMDSLLQKNIIELNTVMSLLDRISAYLHDSIPDLKQSGKDLTRDIAELKKDVALVEHSLQTQINTVNTIKLRQ